MYIDSGDLSNIHTPVGELTKMNFIILNDFWCFWSCVWSEFGNVLVMISYPSTSFIGGAIGDACTGRLQTLQSAALENIDEP